MLDIKKNNNTKEITIFWITKQIKFATLKYRNIKK